MAACLNQRNKYLESGNFLYMMRSAFFCCLFFLVHVAYAQRELVYAKDPAALRSEEIRITHFNLPPACNGFAAIRFADVRPVRSYCGFIRPALQQPARKLSTAPDLETQLNTSAQIRKESAMGNDTLVVVLKNFWLFRSLTDESRMFCRVHALFFTRRADTLYYQGKKDTVLSRHAVVRYEFRDLPALFVEDLLTQLPAVPAQPHKPLPVQEFMQQAYNWISLPSKADHDNGLLISFADFARGRFTPAVFSMRSFEDHYTLLFASEEQQSRYNGKIWGAWFNGELYIRQGRHFSKAFPLERSYFIMNNIRNTEGGYAYSYPLLLNLESGRLE